MGRERIMKIKYVYMYINMYIHTHVFKVKTLLIHWDTGIIMNPC